jgi:hypothetical protein
MSNELEFPLRVYKLTLAAGETRLFPHGRAVAFHLPVQGLNRAVPADSLRVGFGDDGELFPASEGLFISSPGSGRGWTVTRFFNESGSSITLEFMLSADPALLILHGA